MFPTVSKKDKAITQCLVRSAMYLKLHEHKRAVQKLFPGVSKDVQIKIVKFIQELCESLKLHETRRHPLVLIVDEVNYLLNFLKNLYTPELRRNLIFSRGK